jgi:hypothetical protein
MKAIAFEYCRTGGGDISVGIIERGGIPVLQFSQLEEIFSLGTDVKESPKHPIVEIEIPSGVSAYIVNLATRKILNAYESGQVKS